MRYLRSLAFSSSLFLLLSAMGCGSGGTAVAPSGPVIPPPAAASPDVYVVGWEINSAGTKVAMLWKNGVATALTDGTYGAYATALAVSGGDVFVTVKEAKGYGGNFVIELWKNGVVTDLTDGSLDGSATAVAVSADNVYVVGGQAGFDANNNFIGYSGYWTNGVYTTLVTDNVQTQVSGGPGFIAISDSNIYLAGDTVRPVYTSPTSTVVAPAATYWENNVPVVMTDGLTASEVSSIALSGADVYVAGGHCMSLDPDCLVAAYWKNGTEVDLSGPPSLLTGIAVANGTVYASANVTDAGGISSEYWVGGNLVRLADSPYTATNGLVLYGSDVYVVGAIANSACYWKNGAVQSVGEPTSTGYAIAVVAPSN